jgi:GlpG protein
MSSKGSAAHRFPAAKAITAPQIEKSFFINLPHNVPRSLFSASSFAGFTSIVSCANLAPRRMRLIGYLKTEANARLFNDYLTSIDIRSLIEHEGDGAWAVWIHDEEQIPAGQTALARFQQNPSDAQFRGAREKAAAIAQKEREAAETAEKRFFARDAIWPQLGMGPITITLIGISVLVTLVGYFTPIWPAAYDWLAISNYKTVAMLPEIRHGQFWRIVTPIFIHFGILHLLFNMMMMRTFGGLLEARLGGAKFAFMVLVLAVASNLGQYLFAGPAFGGMSGVLYGLFGYVWIRGRVDPTVGLYIDSQSVIFMVGWYFLCLFGIIGNVANGTHTVGLLVGMAWGALPLLIPRRS